MGQTRGARNSRHGSAATGSEKRLGSDSMRNAQNSDRLTGRGVIALAVHQNKWRDDEHWRAGTHASMGA
jgi:hypothetical protein